MNRKDSSSSVSDEAEDYDVSAEVEESNGSVGGYSTDGSDDARNYIGLNSIDSPYASLLTVAGESYTENIQKLSQDFNQLVMKMSERILKLSNDTNASVQQTYQSLESRDFKKADQLVAELRSVIKECDSLDAEFVKIRHIGEIAAGFSQRIVKLEKQFESMTRVN